ncbi:MAG: DUF1801 domain-containing protein [Actinomycetota bacterium]|nr:DUF1801 domain-containing protein [Actinomycetota bacterium]
MGAISDYLASLPPAERTALRHVLDIALDVAPAAVEGRSYGVPALRLTGRPLLGVVAAKGHLSIFPFSPGVIEGVRARLAGYGVSTGTIRFEPGHLLPEDVVRDVVTARAAEIGHEPLR